MYSSSQASYQLGYILTSIAHHTHDKAIDSKITSGWQVKMHYYWGKKEKKKDGGTVTEIQT